MKTLAPTNPFSFHSTHNKDGSSSNSLNLSFSLFALVYDELIEMKD
jgi:hypothetical protein